MKKANREALRIALFDFQEERRLFLEQVRILMENEMNAYGIFNEEYFPKEYDPTAGQDWEIKMDTLEETLERVLDDER